jgi:hypothetical protein
LCQHARRAVDAARLAQLNADSAACISRWRITVAHSEELGRYLVSTTGVPAGEMVMVLPPNLIQSFAEVRDYNTVIQARTRVVLVCARGLARGRPAGSRSLAPNLRVCRCLTASCCLSGCTAPA